jgi:uncharacterized protein YecE (DUF72 family)
MIKWHIGCSGFHYKHWKGEFYPEDLPQRKWFEFYCEHFKTLELNVTFYHFPQPAMLEGWYDRSPAEFRFSVKAPRGITHFKQFHNAGELISRFYETINGGLKEKLGPVLFQMPPRFTYKEERLERIVQSLDASFNNVIELRDPSWWQEDIFGQFAKHHITFCGQSHPKLPDDIIQTTDSIYYRFHGVPHLYSSPYSKEFLQKVVDEIKHNKKVKQAWLYFNNDIGASAIQNANEIMSMIK